MFCVLVLMLVIALSAAHQGCAPLHPAIHLIRCIFIVIILSSYPSWTRVGVSEDFIGSCIVRLFLMPWLWHFNLRPIYDNPKDSFMNYNFSGTVIDHHDDTTDIWHTVTLLTHPNGFCRALTKNSMSTG